MFAFNRAEPAVAYLRGFDSWRTRWGATLSVGRLAGHTSLNLYADGQFVGILQGDILGSALYKADRPNEVQGPWMMPLTWTQVEAGCREVYRHPTPWGTWLCHDITAAVFRAWGFNDRDVYRATPTGRGFAYVAGHVASKLLVPGTLVVLGAHEAWNAFQEGYRRARSAIGNMRQ